MRQQLKKTSRAFISPKQSRVNRNRSGSRITSIFLLPKGQERKPPGRSSGPNPAITSAPLPPSLSKDTRLFNRKKELASTAIWQCCAGLEKERRSMRTKVASAEAAVDDALEREEPLTPDRSYIVQAPAGSGKTGLLVHRMLRLLSVVSRPESIVAMTFTIKAAGEMRERVLSALQEAADNAPVTSDFQGRTRQLALEALGRDREENWGLLTDPGRLQIQTIDALCAML